MKRKLIMSLVALTGALATSTVMGVGCSQPTNNGGYEQEEPNQGNQQGGNQQGGNQQGGEQQGGNTSSYSQPTTRSLANGYTIRNFSGSHSFGKDTVVNATKYYLGEAETYIKGLADNFDNTLKGRNTATQNYFKTYVNALKNNNYYELDSGNSFDMVMNGNSNDSVYVFTDMVANMGDYLQGSLFEDAYQLLANESYKEGLGQYSNMTYYQQQRDSYIRSLELDLKDAGMSYVDFNQDIDNQNCQAITGLINQALTTAAQNMNANKGLNVTASDLRQVINIALTSKSLLGMHERTKTNLGHTGTCSAGMGISKINYAIADARKTLPLVATQDQGMEL